MGTLAQDLQYAFRKLFRTPGFTLVALFTLMLGIGANTAVFTVVNSVLIKPLPFEEPDRLVKVFVDNPEAELSDAPASPLDLEDWQRRNQVFAAMAAYSTTPSGLTLTGDGEPERLPTAYVSGDFFRTLKGPVLLGRALSPADDRPGEGGAVVLSWGLWQRRFGSDPKIVGRVLRLDEAPFTVVGVMDRDFAFPNADVELWAPLSVIGEKRIPRLRQVRWVETIARLKPGVSVNQAEANLQTLARALEQEYPDSNKGWTGGHLYDLHTWLVGDVRKSLFVLLGVVGLVLLIACVNIANLLLARATTRGREMAIRTALGAERKRILQQLLSESLLLSLVGGALGLLISSWAVQVLLSLSGGAIPRIHEIGIDGRVMAFTLLISILTGTAFGIVPALQTAKPEIRGSLGESSTGAGTGKASHRLQSLLVVAEMALAVLLVIGAGLAVKSLWRLFAVDPGFDSRNALVTTFNIPSSRYPERPQYQAFYAQVLERAAHLPGVTAAGAIQSLPLIDQGGEKDILTIQGRPAPPPGQEPIAIFNTIGGDYFGAMGIRLLRGRKFTGADGPESPPVAIINQTLARQHWPEQNPVGQMLLSGETQIQIVGVVGDVRNAGLAKPSEPEVYLPHSQRPRRGVALVVRTVSDPALLAGAVRGAIREMDPSQPITEIATLEQILSESVTPQRFLALLLSIFSAMALILAGLGIYGVLSFVASQRTREVGIRIAMGADRRDILRLIIGQGVGVALLGVVLGLAASLALTRVLASLLYEVSPTDAATFSAVAAVLVMVALLASYIPARRAAGTNPMITLRQE
ncbi:MAG: putative transport system permease protein [Acidobacteriota bacterium]|jgi:putative ABC transport system permease protein|nr:putative transport system permease protein [Acidobacteriota bacterium]